MKKLEKLNIYAKNITSQHGEDGILNYILNKLNDIPKICVDFGAWDGKNLSNIYSLWHDQSWFGILIEADKDRSEKILRDYLGYNIRAFNQRITVQGDYCLDSLFRKNDFNPDIGILSIDIDSYDYHVWKNINYVNPVIVIIEHNHTIPAYLNYHDPEGESFLRCSAKSLEILGKDKGYKLICCTLTNCIFIRNDFFNEEYFPDMPVEYLFDYSSCSAAKLSGFINSSPFKKMDVYYGNPSRIQKYASFIKKIFSVLLMRNKKPSQDVIKACNQAGIKIL